ncbi:MAG: PTS sugar transporter subunit IIA [Deltaproteobacteria bacterium]|nr:PTS sugar transporter subunit IIA [Deltaproteobacteria bacterium]
MTGAVIATHGKLAESLFAAAESITGRMENVRTVSITNADKSDRIRGEISAAIKEVDSGKGVVVFTDMFGGTPTNIALSLMEEGRVEVITGVNLPLLIKFAGHRSERPLNELVLLLKEYGRESIVIAGHMLKEKK